MNKRKWILLIAIIVFIYNLFFPFHVYTYTGIVDYQLMSNMTYKTDEYTYKYRLKITGRVHASKYDTTYVYLSNISDISFDRAWKASGLSSYLGSYFDESEAILVDIIVLD